MRGDLSEMPATDVCRALASSATPGVLEIEGPDGRGAIVFREGRVTAATSPTPRARLGDRLVNAGLLDEDALDEVLRSQARAGTHRRLGGLLVERGLVSHDAIRLVAQEQVIDAVFDVVRWRYGGYRFEPGDLTDDADVPIAIPVDQLLVEVARREQEWAEVERVIPDLEAVPTFVTGTGSAVASLEPDEFTLLASIDGVRSVRELADDLGYGQFEAARIVYGLTMLGIVEVALPEDEIGRALDEALQGLTFGDPVAGDQDVADLAEVDGVGVDSVDEADPHAAPAVDVTDGAARVDVDAEVAAVETADGDAADGDAADGDAADGDALQVEVPAAEDDELWVAAGDGSDDEPIDGPAGEPPGEASSEPTPWDAPADEHDRGDDDEPQPWESTPPSHVLEVDVPVQRTEPPDDVPGEPPWHQPAAADPDAPAGDSPSLVDVARLLADLEVGPPPAADQAPGPSDETPPGPTDEAPQHGATPTGHQPYEQDPASGAGETPDVAPPPTTPRGAEVSELLRELSRLALEDDGGQDDAPEPRRDPPPAPPPEPRRSDTGRDEPPRRRRLFGRG